MRPFDDMPNFRRSRNLDEIWRANACGENKNPDVLWKELWPRFNAVTIALLDEDAFFRDALAVVKRARDRPELDVLMAQRMEERKDELREVLHEIAWAEREHRQRLDSKAAKDAADKVVNAISLDSFMQFVGGAVFGWRGEATDPWKSVCKAPEPPLAQAQILCDDDAAFEDYGFTQYDSEASVDSDPFRPRTPPQPFHKPDYSATMTATARTDGKGIVGEMFCSEPSVQPMARITRESSAPLIASTASTDIRSPNTALTPGSPVLKFLENDYPPSSVSRDANSSQGSCERVTNYTSAHKRQLGDEEFNGCYENEDSIDDLQRRKRRKVGDDIGNKLERERRKASMSNSAPKPQPDVQSEASCKSASEFNPTHGAQQHPQSHTPFGCWSSEAAP